MRHLAISTEQSYCAWVARFCDAQQTDRASIAITSEQRVERFLTGLAAYGVSASTQNQAFNALVLFYREIVGKPLEKVDALRAKAPMHLRRAPSADEVRALLSEVQRTADFSTNLAIRLIYGCGLRVTEPLSLRIKDVLEDRLVIRAAKGGKDRVVALPCSLATDLHEQTESARIVWRRDSAARMPVALPGLLATKYPSDQFCWPWAWLFPAAHPCVHPRTGQMVRWRLHEANVQRAIRRAGRKLNLRILPHELRHAYATHCLDRGANPRALQQAMGHASLETTMGYLHADAMNVRSPIECFV